MNLLLKIIFHVTYWIYDIDRLICKPDSDIEFPDEDLSPAYGMPDDNVCVTNRFCATIAFYVSLLMGAQSHVDCRYGSIGEALDSIFVNMDPQVFGMLLLIVMFVNIESICACGSYDNILFRGVSVSCLMLLAYGFGWFLPVVSMWILAVVVVCYCLAIIIYVSYRIKGQKDLPFLNPVNPDKFVQ